MSDQLTFGESPLVQCPLCHGHGQVRDDDPTANRIGRWSRKGPDTQRDAALLNYPNTGNQRWRILQSLYDDGDATEDKLCQRLGLLHQSCSGRCNDLMHGGWILDTGEKGVRRTGAEGIIWTLSQKAIDYIERERNA
jgi:hypothetical protein